MIMKHNHISLSPSLFIPGVSAKDLIDYESYSSTLDCEGDAVRGLPLLSIILIWRCQYNSILTNAKYDPKDIAQLDTTRFLSKAIAKNKDILTLAATVALNRSLWVEATALAAMNDDEVTSHLSGIVTELVTCSPPRGAKELRQSQIHPDNVQFHRWGTIASLIGSWQSKSLFAPSEVIKGGSISMIDFPTAINMYAQLGGKLVDQKTIDTFFDSIDQEYKESSPTVEAPEEDQDARLLRWFNKEILPPLNSVIVSPSGDDLPEQEEVPPVTTGEVRIFCDAITISNKSNKTPIEETFAFGRTLPTAMIIPSGSDKITNPRALRAMEGLKVVNESSYNKKKLGPTQKPVPPKNTGFNRSSSPSHRPSATSSVPPNTVIPPGQAAPVPVQSVPSVLRPVPVKIEDSTSFVPSTREASPSSTSKSRIKKILTDDKGG